MGRGAVPVGVAVDLVVDQQVAGQHFAVDPLALVAGAGDGLQRFLAGIVDDVERHIEHLGDADGAVGGLALDLRRARQGMALGPGDAELQDLVLQVKDQFAVLAWTVQMAPSSRALLKEFTSTSSSAMMAPL